MKIAILGATKGMGRALARRCAERGDELVLLGRDPEGLQKSVADARALGAGKAPVHGVACDLSEPGGFAEAVAATFSAVGGTLDAFVVTAGRFAVQEDLEADPELAREVLTVNFANTVALCEHVRPRLLAQPQGGTLCAFSSVAGDRGRKPVVLYGASKAGLSAYLEGLDHRYRADGLRTVCVKPGFVKTSMTAGLKPPPFAGEPEGVAAQVLRAIDRGAPMVYAPSMWRWVMLVIRNLPRTVMRRVGF